MEQSNDKLTQVFNTIYETNTWGYGSGSGSREHINVGYVQFLQQFFKSYQIQSVVDIGCGDWQFSKNLNLEGIDYKGYDVASFVVNRNLAKYKKQNIDFIHYDGDFSTLPSADLAICKDVLQHLPNHNIQQFIENLSKYKYALIANDIDRVGENDDILLDIYAYRSLDLRKDPFNLPLEVVFEIVREPKEPNIAVMLWQNPNLN
ncbi:class I SAM-dependent methyltransferase [Helicobacter sp. MIT 05-5294]|uniref:class I SAM-dependent methyltransferase n=1 Tax=Helicobacter sp. MIT 05-5294 TaxID=1548150 RepID=UPI000AF03843|nr:class I SAM-dependent methyltransferase [Helicobacter sp. MIT 05-5294]